MISGSQASKQINRLAVLRFYPSTAEAQAELIDALKAISANESDAAELISDWIKNNGESPTPVQLSLSRDFWAQQVRRLSGLRFFPMDLAAQRELMASLQSSARDEAHAKRIVSDWLRYNRETPTPADLHALRLKDIHTKSLEELI